jgi:hypothetical protein
LWLKDQARTRRKDSRMIAALKMDPLTRRVWPLTPPLFLFIVLRMLPSPVFPGSAGSRPEIFPKGKIPPYGHVTDLHQP